MLANFADVEKARKLKSAEAEVQRTALALERERLAANWAQYDLAALRGVKGMFYVVTKESIE